MIPLSYQSIGFTFIFLMVVCLVISETVQFVKGKMKKSRAKSGVFEK